MRLYERDSYLRNVTTRVLACLAEGDRFAVRLEDVLLYPGGGGQPPDHGTVDGLAVLEMRSEEDGEIVHLLPGEVGGEVVVELDWPRRYDHMQQHTAQHIITAVALAEFDLPTVAYHIGESVCDIEFDTEPLAAGELERLEARVNDHVRRMLPVRIEEGTPEEVASGLIRSRRLPRGVEGPLRIVTLEGLDRNTCGGTHVDTTGELQLIKFVGTERLTRSYRVIYAAGDRVRRLFAERLTTEDELTSLLTCSATDLVANVSKLHSEARRAGKAQTRLLARLADSVAAGLCEGDGGWAFHHEPSAEPAFIRAVALAVRKARPERRLMVAGGEDSGPFAVAGPPDWVAAAAPVIAELLSGRGGGRDGLFQGKAGSYARLTEAQALVETGGFGAE